MRGREARAEARHCDRFCGVGAWRVSSNFAVFLRCRDRGSEDAVVFPEIGGDYDDKSLKEKLIKESELDWTISRLCRNVAHRANLRLVAG